MDQMYLNSQGQARQHQLKFRVPILPDDGPPRDPEIPYTQIRATAAISISYQLPIPGQRQKCLFPTQLCFFFIRLPTAEQYMHTKYIIYIEVSTLIFIVYTYILHNSISKHSVNMDSGRKWNLSGFRNLAILSSPAPHPWYPSLFGFMALCHLSWCFPSKWHFSFGFPRCPAPSPGLALGCHMVQMACRTLIQSALKNLPSCCLCWQPAWWLHGLQREHDAAWK